MELDPKELRKTIADRRHARLGVPFIHMAVTDLRLALPTPEELRRLAAYVDVAVLRRIDDPDVIAEQFDELKNKLLLWATALELFDAST
jgi:hypothetical protein